MSLPVCALSGNLAKKNPQENNVTLRRNTYHRF
jgi:hypothetical protein